nr:unnamed protein product [Callosobruchus analis]
MKKYIYYSKLSIFLNQFEITGLIKKIKNNHLYFPIFKTAI